MTIEWEIVWESDFTIIDEEELQNMKKKWKLEIDKNIEEENGNLKEDLIKLWFLDYENMSDEEKKIFDELENEKREKWYYELD